MIRREKADVLQRELPPKERHKKMLEVPRARQLWREEESRHKPSLTQAPQHNPELTRLSQLHVSRWLGPRAGPCGCSSQQGRCPAGGTTDWSLQGSSSSSTAYSMHATRRQVPGDRAAQGSNSYYTVTIL